MQGVTAVAYARYSTELQTDNSIAVQIKGITEYCAKSGLNLVDIYTDEACTGTNTHRPGFMRLMADAASHKFQAVVVYDITRGSRNVVDWFQFRQQMHALGVAVHSATEKLGDVSDPSAYLTELLTVGIGQHQVLQSRQKSIAGKRNRAEKGLFCGGLAPLGYDIINGEYVINKREAEAVKLAFELYAAGKSYSHICAQVARLGVTGKRGQAIGANTLHFIFKNPRYAGTYVWFEEEVRYLHKHVGKKHSDPVNIPDKIPRIVSDETWKAVKCRMENNKKNTLNKSRVNREYMLSGLIHCGLCGGAYSGSTTTVKKKSGLEYEYRGYFCTNKNRLHKCKNRRIGADDIESLVVALVTDSILNDAIIEKTADAIIEAVSAHAGDDKADIKKEIARLEGSIMNLSKSLEYDNDDVRQVVNDRIAENSARIKILKSQLGDSEAMPTVTREDLINQLRADTARLQSEPGAMRELLQKYIVRVDIAPDSITIHAVADLAHPKPLHVLPNPPQNNKNVDTPDDGVCQHDWLPR